LIELIFLHVFWNKKITAVAVYTLVLLPHLCAQTKQRQVTVQALVWQTWNQTLEFNPKFSVRFEFIAREFIAPFQLHQAAARIRLHYAINRNWSIGGGFARFNHYPGDPLSTARFAVPELRPHLEASYEGTVGKFTITHRYRVENRFMRNSVNEALVAGYTSTYRFRYRLGLDYILLKDAAQRPLKFRFTNEILINFGRNIQYNVFDNNRVTAGLNYSLPGNFAVEIGFMHWYQQRSSGYQFYNRSIFTIAVFHKLKLYK